MRAPDIDLRDRDRLLAEVKAMIQKHGVGPMKADISGDPKVLALANITARFLELSTQRINKLQEKSFLAFLRALGVTPTPPRSASVLLTFFLTEGADPTLVPAGTQVAGMDSQGEAVVFETQNNLTAISQGPIALYSLDAERDHYSDHSHILNPEVAEKPESLFETKKLLEHSIFFGDGKQFQVEGPSRISLEITFNHLTKLKPFQDAKVGWFCFNPESGKETPLKAQGRSEVLNLQASGTIELTIPHPLVPTPIQGYDETAKKERIFNNVWICAKLLVPYQTKRFSPIRSITTTITPLNKENPIHAPAQASFNFSELDLSKDFYPFGEEPQFNDCFYILSNQVFSQQDMEVTVSFHRTMALPQPKPKQLVLRWERFNGKQWIPLELRGWRSLEKQGKQPFQVTDYLFDQSAQVVFQCPEIHPLSINDEEGFWIRIRIVKGDFGKPGFYKEIPDKEGKTQLKYFEASFRPPSFSRVELSYQPKPITIEQVVTKSGFSCQEWLLREENPKKQRQIQKEPSQPAYFYPFEPWPKAPLDEKTATKQSFGGQPLLEAAPMSSQEKSLYLGFEQNIAELPINLFFALAGDGHKGNLPPESITKPLLQWEYYDGTEWKPLMVMDATQELSTPAIISFLAPSDQKPHHCFERKLNWVRARLKEGTFSSPPRISRIHNNAVWANQWISEEETLIGSGLGTPNQALEIPNAPILPGEEVWVLEKTLLAHEKAQVTQEEGPDAIIELYDDNGYLNETWVRWHRVPHFYNSKADSRHYLLDSTKGILTFGDGIKGMLVPMGADNVSLRNYRHGGGTRGNLGAGSVTELYDSIPFIDGAINPIAAEGGKDGESAKEIKRSGPIQLKTRGVAVTPEDYEYMALQASSSVARVKCLSNLNRFNQFKPGHVTVIIVSDASHDKPQPSVTLLDQVRRHILERSPSILTKDPRQISVVGPKYLKISFHTELVIHDLNRAKEIETQAHQALRLFLHPIKGGRDQRGLDFGKKIYQSQLFELLENIEGVDYVPKIEMTANIQIYRCQHEQAESDYAFVENSILSFEQGRIQFRLAYRIKRGVPFCSMRMLGLMEEDLIKISSATEGVSDSSELHLSITDIETFEQDDKLHVRLGCIPMESPANFAPGCTVTTPLRDEKKNVCSYLTQGLKKGQIVDHLFIALPQEGSNFQLIHRDHQQNFLEIRFHKLEPEFDCVYSEQSHLAYPGEIQIDTRVKQSQETNLTGQITLPEDHYLFKYPMKSDEEPDEELFILANQQNQQELPPYLVELDSGIVHDGSKAKSACRLKELEEESIKIMKDFKQVQIKIATGKLKACPHCMPNFKERS